jgi:hypothetical protein
VTGFEGGEELNSWGGSGVCKSGIVYQGDRRRKTRKGNNWIIVKMTKWKTFRIDGISD